MANFEYTYKAVDGAAKVFQGSLQAPDEQTVVGWLRARGQYPIRIARKDASAASAALTRRGRLDGRPSREDVLTFTQQFHTLLNAGLEVDRSLAILGELAETGRMQRLITQILADVQRGLSVADSLAKHPRSFSRFYINMVKAGETGGVLEVTLGRLAAFLESARAVQSEILSALLYPCLVMTVGGGAVFVLLNFVIPRFGKLFTESGQLLPVSTQILLSISHFTSSYWWIALGALGLLALGGRGYLQTDEGRAAWDRAILAVPVFGPLVREMEVGRFARTFGTLLQSGVPVLTALRIVAETIGNTAMAQALPPLMDRVKRGEGIAGPLKASGVFPPLAVHMTAVGEETGKLEEMLLRVADAYDAHVRTAIKRLLSLLEPVLILVMGLIVGFIVVSMLLAILTISDLPI
jgi:type II secretion system protein F